MALELWPQFTGGSYLRINAYVDSERCINLYPETSGKGENNRAQMRLVSTPGTTQVADFFVSLSGLTGPIYDIVTATQQSGAAIAPRTFALVGDGASGLRLVEYRGTSLSPINWGNCGSQPPNNTVQPKLTIGGQDQILISNGGAPSTTFQTGAVFSLNTGVMSLFNVTAQPGWLGASDTDFLDGYAIASQPGTQVFYISALQDVTSWDPLDVAVENDAPDTIVGLRVLNRDLFVFGKSRILVWNNTGASAFPFTRNNSATIEVGCVNAQSIQKLNGSLFWIGRDQRGGFQAWKLQGYNAVRISTTAVEQIWQNFFASGPGNESDLATLQAFSYQEEGHSFYVVNFPNLGIPSPGVTWVYDDTEGLWHERLRGTSADGVLRQRCHTFNPLYGHLVGSRDTAQLFLQSRNIGTENGVTLGRYRITPHLYDGSYRDFYKRLVLDIDTGVPSNAISLSYSNNGGVNFNATIAPSVTNRGSGVRVAFNRLGSGLDRVFGLTISNLSGFAIAAAYLDVQAQQK